MAQLNLYGVNSSLLNWLHERKGRSAYKQRANKATICFYTPIASFNNSFTKYQHSWKIQSELTDPLLWHWKGV